MLNLNILKSERFRRLSKEGFWVILGQAMAVVGSLVGVRLLTELLDPASYGELALGMTVATLVNQTLLGPLSSGVTRFYAPAVEQGDLGGYLSAVRRLVVSATGIVMFIILVAVAGLFVTGRTEWIAIAIVALIFATLSGYNSILSGIQNAARQRSVVALHQGIEPWGRFLAAAGLMILMGATSTVAMIGYALGVILVIGSQYVFFRKIATKNIIEADKEINWREQMLKYSWPFASWGIFTWAQLVSDRWALGLFATMQDVGMYAVLFQLGYYPMSMATGIAMQFLAPIFYQRAGDASDSLRNDNVSNLSRRLTWMALGVTAVAFLVVFLFHTQIFRIFVNKEYAAISYLLPWMVLAGGVFAASQTLALNLMSQMKTQTMTVAKIITALAGVLFNFVGAYWYGSTGIVMAGVFFS
ncbi:oligosaccharide flippase family protein, partial [bacterium]|nr:oligosaccharide flippase family protein [bacterium]